ncbi:DeoR/GlpR family DNA-binding transcription regulator [Rubellimicrobium aerolatum]|uniref:DeoR/GlpR family DNA-binding transcription regulator n=1 Tax=Rubellimicrobium aerolatum TaxID=490979 RepID=A0ABW0SF00_9RHOB|nr:DeoR/GlpR family DNA-binding transcription regulator [Rubellimicrobium aerolatum]MBP1806938.1 DeoR family glycerol-3-phosphate regulon repressor [Rubellimicrobium aerolatum]
MKPQIRHEEILRFVQQSGEATVEDLAAALQVSRETIRRDLTQLDAAGLVRKVHGGARPVVAPEQRLEGPFALRMAANVELKRRIGRKAAELLCPGDSLFIDSGSTTLLFAEALTELSSMIIITNSWRIAATVGANPSHRVFLIGGSYSADVGESLGQLAIEQIRQLRATHAFLTVGTVEEAGVLDFDEQETDVAQAILERVEQVTVLADSSKFGRRGVFKVADWAQIDRLVTDAMPADEITKSAQANSRTEIILA